MTRDVERVPYEASSRVSSLMKPRVAHRDGRARWARLLTAPLGRGAGIRCDMRDPDGCLFQVGQAAGRRQAGRTDGR
jgi:hypothetical protein